MIYIKNKAAIEKMRIAGHKLAEIMIAVSEILVPGISTLEIDRWIEGKMKFSGLVPVCKGYAGYRYATLISLNDVVVHGIPSEKIVLKSGDFVKIDVVGGYRGYCADMARPYFIGEANVIALQLAAVAQRALDFAIECAVPLRHLSDLSAAIQAEVEAAGFGVVRDFAGHGIGKDLHEEPDIVNFGKAGEGPLLREGMTLAIEPMITEKEWNIVIMEDGWTAKTADGGLAAHVEDTIVITRDAPEILTRVG